VRASVPGYCLRRALILAVLLVSIPAIAHADLLLLVGEPFGSFGTMMPSGHTAIYLDRVCANGPLRLRMCRAGEQPGVVLARYHAIGRYDWLAIPVMDYLFATDRMEEVPRYATPAAVWALREKFRQRYLRAIVPDGMQGKESGEGISMGGGSLEEWWESAGAVYDRRIWVYQAATTPAEDEHLVAVMNADRNLHRYQLRKNNCADFAADLVNLYFPDAVHRDRIADFGLMSPKQVARCLTEYASSRPELRLRKWEIPQTPGSLRRSRPVRCAAEAGLTTKRYLFTLIAIQPEVPVALTVLYLWHGRWKVGEGAEPMPGFPYEMASHGAERSGAEESARGAEGNLR